jgi:hypothetical protein
MGYCPHKRHGCKRPTKNTCKKLAMTNYFQCIKSNILCLLVKKICLKKFSAFTVRHFLTAMGTLIRNATNNQESTAFTKNRNSAPPYNSKMAVDGNVRLDDMRRLYYTGILFVINCFRRKIRCSLLHRKYKHN